MNIVKNQVVSVFEIIRHGARQPSNMESVSQSLLYGTAADQLTANGFKQHLLLGKALYSKYRDLLSNESTEVKIMSSPRQRCVFSATAQILGIFQNTNIKYTVLNEIRDVKTDDLPPGYENAFNTTSKKRNLKQDKKEKLISMSIADPSNDGMFRPDKCFYSKTKKAQNQKEEAPKRKSPRFRSLLGSSYIKNTRFLGKSLKKNEIFVLSKEEIKKAIDEIMNGLEKSFEKYVLPEEWDWPFDDDDNKYNIVSLGQLIKFLNPLRYHFSGKTKDLLTFTQDVEDTIKKQTINHFYEKKLVDNEEKRLLFTEMMKDILNNLEKENIFALYSAHDTTIVNFLTNMLNLDQVKKRLLKAGITKDDEKKEYDFFIPPFASSLIFEISKQEDTKFIKIIYNNKEILTDFVKGIEYVENKGIKVSDFKKVFENLVVDTSQGEWICKDSNLLEKTKKP